MSNDRDKNEKAWFWFCVVAVIMLAEAVYFMWPDFVMMFAYKGEVN